jgi:superfamily II DNA or RNA helicase
MHDLPGRPLYPWQNECLKQWLENGRRGIVDAATGSGKTALALAAARLLAAESPAPVRVKIITPKIFLARQWRQEIENLLGAPRADTGIYYGTQKDAPARPYMIYVLNSARRSIARHILADMSDGYAVFLICDECHHFASEENRHVFDFLPFSNSNNYYAMGLSATPDCDHMQEVLVPALGKPVFRYSIADAANDQVVAQYAVFNMAVSFAPDERLEYDDLTHKIAMLRTMLFRKLPASERVDDSGFLLMLTRLSRRGDEIGDIARSLHLFYIRRKAIVHHAAARISAGVEILRLLPADERVIVFSERIVTANALYAAVSKRFPSKAVLYHSELDTLAKKRALDRYASGERSIIICCRALDEGLNVPDTDTGIILSCSSGSRQRIQRIGRLLRKNSQGTPKKVFYLHIPGTSENPNVLHEMPEGVPVFSLRYDSDTMRVRRRGYGAPAARVLAFLKEKGASSRQLSSAKKHLARGIVGAECALSEAACEELLHQTESRDEKNYLSTMLLLVRAKKGLYRESIHERL